MTCSFFCRFTVIVFSYENQKNNVFGYCLQAIILCYAMLIRINEKITRKEKCHVFRKKTSFKRWMPGNWCRR